MYDFRILQYFAGVHAENTGLEHDSLIRTKPLPLGAVSHHTPGAAEVNGAPPDTNSESMVPQILTWKARGTRNVGGSQTSQRAPVQTCFQTQIAVHLSLLPTN